MPRPKGKKSGRSAPKRQPARPRPARARRAAAAAPPRRAGGGHASRVRGGQLPFRPPRGYTASHKFVAHSEGGLTLDFHLPVMRITSVNGSHVHSLPLLATGAAMGPVAAIASSFQECEWLACHFSVNPIGIPVEKPVELAAAFVDDPTEPAPAGTLEAGQYQGGTFAGGWYPVDSKKNVLQATKRLFTKANPADVVLTTAGIVYVLTRSTAAQEVGVLWLSGRIRFFDIKPIEPAAATLRFRAKGGDSIAPGNTADGIVDEVVSNIGRVFRGNEDAPTNANVFGSGITIGDVLNVTSVRGAIDAYGRLLMTRTVPSLRSSSRPLVENKWQPDGSVLTSIEGVPFDPEDPMHADVLDELVVRVYGKHRRARLADVGKHVLTYAVVDANDVRIELWRYKDGDNFADLAWQLDVTSNAISGASFKEFARTDVHPTTLTNQVHRYFVDFETGSNVTLDLNTNPNSEITLAYGAGEPQVIEFPTPALEFVSDDEGDFSTPGCP